MTNAQKWVTAFLVLFILLFALSKLTEKDEVIFEESGYENQTETQTQSAEPDGLALITRSGCASCHGSDLKGTQVGPSLLSVKKYWSRDGLINYLRNPSSYNGDDRFEEYKSIYKNVIMPSYSNIEVKDLGRIADYLLNQ